MKKFVKVVSIVAALSLAVAMMTGCKANVTSTSSSENSVTRNGITRTETTVTTNGNTSTTVTYKDANGNELSAEVGEAAFNNTAAAAPAAESTAAEKEGTEASADAEKISATFSFSNLSGHPVKGLYIVTENHEDWGTNLLEAGGELANETMRTWPDGITYTAGCTWKMAVQFADAEDGAMTGFSDLHFDTATDPHNLSYTITPNEAGDGYTLTRE